MSATNPFDGRPLRVTIGTRPLDDAQWLMFDAHYATDMAEKAILLAERHEDVVAHEPAGDAAARELLDMVLEHLASCQRDRFVIDGAKVRDVHRGTTVDTGVWHPIDAAGRLVQEDLTVMTRDSAGDWRLTAASVCFPSRWRLADKIGADLTQIHEPVPFYEERIGAAVRQQFERLDPDRPTWRLNWTLLNDSARFQPEGTPWTGGPVDFGTALFFRVERQTLRRLPRTQGIAFTIRTTVEPLAALSTIPDAYRTLAQTLEQTDPRTVAYKGWAAFHEPLVEWLRAQSTPVDA